MTEPYGVADLLAHQRKGVRVILGDEVPASVYVDVPSVATLGVVPCMTFVPAVPIRVFAEPVGSVVDTYVYISTTMVR
jgi:hypothetical protein